MCAYPTKNFQTRYAKHTYFLFGLNVFSFIPSDQRRRRNIIKILILIFELCIKRSLLRRVDNILILRGTYIQGLACYRYYCRPSSFGTTSSSLLGQCTSYIVQYFLRYHGEHAITCGIHRTVKVPYIT